MAQRFRSSGPPKAAHGGRGANLARTQRLNPSANVLLISPISPISLWPLACYSALRNRVSRT
jgi:hypothetical protein